MNNKLIIDGESFFVNSKFMETLDEIAFINRYASRADVLQHAITMLYVLSREGHEHQALAMLQYPNGHQCHLQFANPVERPTFHPAATLPLPQIDHFETYQNAMPSYASSPAGQVANDNKYE